MLTTRYPARAALGAAFLFAAASAFAQAPQGGAGAAGAGTVTHLSGVLAVRRDDGATRFLSTNSAVGEGDVLSTARDTYARVKFRDGGEVVLRPGSQLKVDAYSFDEQVSANDNVLLSLLKGGMRSVTGILGRRSSEKVKLRTASATIGIRGTHFGMLLCQNDCAGIATASGQALPNGLHVDVADGAIAIRNPAGEQVLSAGQFGYVRDSATPPVLVPPQQGIQVTMPPSISSNSAGGRSVGRERSDAECTTQ